MKAKFLKIAGVKSEKEFYKKFPTEEAFMKAHGKELKKAQWGVAQMAAKSLQELGNKFTNPVAIDPVQTLQQANISAPTVNQLPNAGVPFEPMSQTNMVNWNYNQPPQVMNPNSPEATMTRDRQEFESYSNILDDYNKSMMPKQNATSQKGNKKNPLSKAMNTAGELVQGIQQLREEKRARLRAEQAKGVSDVALQASRTRDVDANRGRRYVRPEDQRVTGEEMFPIYGVGTNVLTAKHGAEIANTFAPNTLYTDLDEKGKEMPRAFTGLEIAALKSLGGKTAIGGKAAKFLGADGNITFNDLGDAGVADFASNMMTSIGGENAGGNIGGTIGKQFGPAGELSGKVLGRMLNTNPKRTRRAQEATLQNLGATTLNTAMQRNQIQNNAFMEDGGRVSPYEWVSHTWQPQKIVSFGEHKMSDLLKPDRTMDTLRAGGHLKDYTPPSEEAMSTERPSFAFGGELQTHWGGYAEPMSYNPYMPGGGETVMFRGQSHDESDGKGRTGIGVTYGENPVEVERGEPAIKMKDGGEAGGDSMVVFGNLKIPYQLLGDKEAKGKNFKNYVAKISKQEEKLNKSIDKSSSILSSLDDDSPFGKLKFNSYKANLYGANEKLKAAAEKKMDAAALQSAMNDTVEEYGLKTSDKGIISAKQGIQIAQDGEKLPTLNDSDYDYLVKLYNEAEKQKTGPAVLKFQKEYHRLAPEYAKSVIGKYPVTAYGKEKGLTALERESNEDSIFGKRTKQYMAALQKTAPKRKPEELIPIPKRPLPTVKTPDILTKGPMELNTPAGEPKKDNVPFLKNIFNQALPFLRPSDAEPLDPSQLYGEMYALATNQLEPVRAQSFQPELGVPYDISYQDILNQNQADYRAQQRLAGNNPAALAILNSQKYQANQKVLGEQFRANQAMKDAVWKENRAILNASKLKNLDIYDQQYVRQEEAKSKTKATTQAVVDSIASKFAQKQLENRTLQVYENQYNYRYDPRFRAINMNPLYDFNTALLTPVTYEEGNVVQYVKKTEKKDKYGRPEGSSTTVTSKTKGRNGAIVKALKSI